MAENRKNLSKISILIALTSLAFVLLSCFLNIPFYYLIFGIIFVVVIFQRIEYGIYLMAFFLPLINLNFSLRSLEIPFIDLLGFSVFFVYLVKVFLARSFDKIEFPHIFSFSLFFIAAILSSLFSDNIFGSIWYSLRWILFFYLIYIVLPFNAIKNEKILKNTLIAFLLSVLSVALMGLISVLSQAWFGTIARVRPISIFGLFPIGENQNLMVETLLPGIYIFIALKYFIKKDFYRKFINILILFVASILILTFSRGAWISLFFVSFLIGFIYYQKNILKMIIPFFILMVVMIPVFFYMINLQTTYSIGVSSNKSRLLLTEIAWNSFKEHLILGKGTGTYFNTVAENIRFRANYYDPVDSHGILQKVLLENGLLGILSLSIFVFAIFKKYLNILSDRKYIELYLPVIAAALSLFIFELVNTSYYKGKIWFVVALSLVVISLIENKKIYAK